MTQNPLGSLVTNARHLHYLRAIDVMEILSCRSCQCEVSGITVLWRDCEEFPSLPIRSTAYQAYQKHCTMIAHLCIS